MGINSLLPWKNSNVELDKKAFEDFQRRMSTLNDAKVLVVGGGGREHAIVDALSRSSHVGKIYCAPGNAGIAAQAECIPIKDTEIEKAVQHGGIGLGEGVYSLMKADLVSGGHLIDGVQGIEAAVEEADGAVQGNGTLGEFGDGGRNHLRTDKSRSYN